MAFTPATLSLSVDTISGGSLRIHFYTTADSQVTVLATDYFLRVAKSGVRLGDMVIIKSNVSGTFIAEFTAIDNDGNGTVEIDDVALPINVKTSAYTVVADDRISTLALGGNALYTVTFGAATGFVSDFQIDIVNTDTGRAKFIDLNGTKYRIDPNQATRVFRNGSAWKINLPDRRTLRANLTVRVAPTGSDTLNDGLAVGSEFATIQKAVDYACSLDHGAYTTTVKVADGTYVIADGVTAARVHGAITGQVLIVIEGNVPAPENVIIEMGTGTTFVDAKDYGCAVVQGFTVQAGAGKTGIVVLRAHQLGILDFGAMYFGDVSSTGIHLQIMKGGHATSTLSCAISGGARAHLSITEGGRFEYSPSAATTTITEDVTWGLAFLNITDGGNIRFPSAKAYGIVGGKTATGPRWRADNTAELSLDNVTLEFITANAGSTSGAMIENSNSLSGPIWASGGGIKFPATQVDSSDANTLDDYEEATTTPTPTSGSGSFTAVSAAVKSVKVGRKVSVSGSVTVTTNGTAAAHIAVPVPLACGGLGSGACGIRTDSGVGLSGYIAPAGSTVYLFTSDGTYPGVDGATILFECTYQV